MRVIVAAAILLIVGLAGCSDSPSTAGNQTEGESDPLDGTPNEVANLTAEVEPPLYVIDGPTILEWSISDSLEGSSVFRFLIQIGEDDDATGFGTSTSNGISTGWTLGMAAVPEPSDEVCREEPVPFNQNAGVSLTALDDLGPGVHEVFMYSLAAAYSANLRWNGANENNGDQPIPIEPIATDWRVAATQVPAEITPGPTGVGQFTHELVMPAPGFVNFVVAVEGLTLSQSSMETSVVDADGSICYESGTVDGAPFNNAGVEFDLALGAGSHEWEATGGQTPGLTMQMRGRAVLFWFDPTEATDLGN